MNFRGKKRLFFLCFFILITTAFPHKYLAIKQETYTSYSSSSKSNENFDSQSSTISSNNENEKNTEGSTSSSNSEEIRSSEKSKDTLSDETTPVIRTNALQNGTTTYPYQVSSSAELIAALSKSTPSTTATGNMTGRDPLTIQLTSDITYTSSDTFTFNKNTVLDGNGNFILYRGSSYGDQRFLASQSGINVTIKNVSYGNPTYPNSSYYGFLTVTASNVTLNVSDITYNITNGSQPFYAGSSGCTLNLSGTNIFNSAVGASTSSYGGEFSEGYTTINVAADSSTTVNDKGPNDGGTADFWGYGSTRVNINVGNNAIFDMISRKELIFYGSNNNTISVGQNATFSSKKIYTPDTNLYSYSQFNSNTSNTTNINVSSGGIVDIAAGPRQLSTGIVNINATDSGKVSFYKDSSSTLSKQILYAGSIKFNNLGTNIYQILSTSLTSSTSSTLVSSILPSASSTVGSSSAPSYAGKNSIIYQPAMSITGVSGAASIGVKKSQITANLVGFSSSLSKWDYNSEYLVSSTRYYDSTNNVINQSNLNTDYASDTKPDGVHIVSESGSDGSGLITDLLAGTYYVYGRASASNGPSTVYTEWYETTITVEKYIAALFPSNLGFTSPGGTILNNEAVYRITSQSNTPITITLIAVTTGADSDSSIRLVDTIPNNSENTLSLNLIAKLSDSATNWPLLATGSNNTLTLQPYFETGNIANLTLTGAYSGHYNFIKKVDYLLDFRIQASS